MTQVEQLTLQVKSDSLGENGTFIGIATSFGNVDRTGDRIDATAFDASVGTEVPILFAHKTDEPVGLGKLEKSGDGILLKGQLNLETVAGREAYSNLKAGIIRSLSIGFELVKSAFEGAVRVIKQGVIREVSLVLFPANQRALVLSVKDDARPAAARKLSRFLIVEKDENCECDCPECEAGNCEDCSDPDCDDENCEGEQKSAAKSLLAYL